MPPTGRVDNFLHRSRLGEPPPTEWKRQLRLEWFSQNGHVSLQLIDPELAIVTEVDGDERLEPMPEPDPPPFDTNQPPDTAGPDIIQVRRNDAGDLEISRGGEDTPEEEDSGVFLPDLDQATAGFRQGREETLAGVDPEDPLADAILMDRLFDQGKRGMNLGEVLCRMPDAASLSEERAINLLKLLIGRLALFHVAYHICEHLDPREAYRILVEELASEGEVQPELRGRTVIENPHPVRRPIPRNQHS